MTVLSLYHWDFHRLADDFDLRFETCSITIFQWRQKAAGKGLKKVNVCRVCGFTADVNAVYARAQELCDRLNAEQADATNRPAWLQKQYSVPRPPSVSKPQPRTDRLSPGAVRQIRERVMNRLLLPKGFVRGENATWIRRRGEQIHLIYFQGSQYGREYFVNLGLHYAFLPPLVAQEKIALTKYQLLDCGLEARLKGTFPYGADGGELECRLEQNVTDCLQAFAKAERLFARPGERFLGTNGRRKPPRSKLTNTIDGSSGTTRIKPISVNARISLPGFTAMIPSRSTRNLAISFKRSSTTLSRAGDHCPGRARVR
jgi:hypothetical protein